MARGWEHFIMHLEFQAHHVLQIKWNETYVRVRTKNKSMLGRAYDSALKRLRLILRDSSFGEKMERE